MSIRAQVLPRQFETGKWKLEARNSNIETGKSKLENGNWKLENRRESQT
jgi:hypothetical protein